jgi:2-iminobutanoate/2-iminopropanoate deaminase
MKKVINTSEAPAAIGPYSQAIRTKGLLFVSGQIPLNPQTGQVMGETIQEQTAQVLKNMESILKEAGYSMNDVVKTTCFLTDMGNFQNMNTTYARFFTDDAPARVAVQVSRLPKDVLIEIDAIAVK